MEVMDCQHLREHPWIGIQFDTCTQTVEKLNVGVERPLEEGFPSSAPKL